MRTIEITYFSDVLCILAYVAQARIDAVKEKFGDTVQIKHHFCSVFGDTARKIPSSWGKQDGYEKFNVHLRKVADRFPPFRSSPPVMAVDTPSDFGKCVSFLESKFTMVLHSPVWLPTIRLLKKMRIEGSPSFVLNEGRQKLYGNVGFRLMEANIQELLRQPRSDEASWC